MTRKLCETKSVYETNTRHGKMKRIHPLFAIQERLERRLLALEDRFGLSPQARQSIMLRLATAPALPFTGGADPAGDTAPQPARPATPTLGFLNPDGATIN